MRASPKLSFFAPVMPAGIKDNRMSAGQGIGLALPTQRSPWRFSGRLTDPPWNRSLAKLVQQISLQRQRSFAGVIRRLEQDCG
jgi:hypothetical protein